MVQYIKDIANALDSHIGQVSLHSLPSVQDAIRQHLTALVEEIDRLDPRDFAPSDQSAFALLRIWFRKKKVWLETPYTHGRAQIQPQDVTSLKQSICQLVKLLDSYMGEGSRAETREFTFIKDSDLKDIIRRDYSELCLKLFPSGAWKSTVIMAGSILEAILHDVLTSDPTRQAAALASPEKGNGPIERWDLVDLIEVAVDIRILPKERGKSIDQVLRDFRNLVHPKKEVRTKISCKEPEAYLAKGNLDAVCDHLEATIK